MKLKEIRDQLQQAPAKPGPKLDLVAEYAIAGDFMVGVDPGLNDRTGIVLMKRVKEGTLKVVDISLVDDTSENPVKPANFSAWFKKLVEK